MAWSEKSPVSYEKYERLRDSAGLTDYKVAKACGFSKTLLSEWKNGTQGIGIKTLLSISALFGVPIEAFIDTQ